MAKVKKSTNSSGYIKKAKIRISDDVTGNFTFRFKKKDVEAFKKICVENEVSMTDVLREFIEDVINNN